MYTIIGAKLATVKLLIKTAEAIEFGGGGCIKSLLANIYITGTTAFVGNAYDL